MKQFNEIVEWFDTNHDSCRRSIFHSDLTRIND